MKRTRTPEVIPVPKWVSKDLKDSLTLFASNQITEQALGRDCLERIKLGEGLIRESELVLSYSKPSRKKTYFGLPAIIDTLIPKAV